MFEETQSIILGLVVWILALWAVLYFRWRRKFQGAGITLAYLLNLWLIHWPGALIFTFPWYANREVTKVAEGFAQSTYGVMAFAAGTILLGPLVTTLLRMDTKAVSAKTPASRLPGMFIVFGFLCYVVLVPVLGKIPTLTALLTAGINLAVVGLGLNCWRSFQSGRVRSFRFWLLCAVSLPFVTIVSQGFLGYGFAALLAVLALIGSFYKPRWKIIVLSVIFGYLGLSFYGSYMRDRNDIRAVVWGGEGIVARISSVGRTVLTTELFDFQDSLHLARVDERLNQNHLVGSAVLYLRSGMQRFGNGDSFVEAAMALVPRFLWPSKPIYGGSPGIVTKYTGIRFVEGTSVGVGQVMEFYINFGTLGVFLGFFVLGGLVSLIDYAAGQRLRLGDWQSYSLWYLPGLAMLQVGGSLVEVTSSTGAAFVTAFLVNNLFLKRFGGRKISQLERPSAVRFPQYEESASNLVPPMK